MRIVANNGNDELVAIEVRELRYDEASNVSGLYVECYDGSICGIPGLSKGVCNELARELARVGYVDISMTGELLCY